MAILRPDKRRLDHPAPRSPYGGRRERRRLPDVLQRVWHHRRPVACERGNANRPTDWTPELQRRRSGSRAATPARNNHLIRVAMEHSSVCSWGTSGFFFPVCEYVSLILAACEGGGLLSRP